jgi:hypothetical protein
VPFEVIGKLDGNTNRIGLRENLAQIVEKRAVTRSSLA